MRKLGFTYQTKYTFDIPIYEHYYTLKIYPRENERQYIETLVETMSYGDSHSYSYDSFGNKTVYGFMESPHELFQFEVSGIIVVDDRKKDRDDHLLSLFKSASSMTKPSVILRDALMAAKKEAEAKSCYHKCFDQMSATEQVMYLSDYCHELLTYTPNVTSVLTDASEALRIHQGVCQDYSHILIALLRMLSIPARYVVGFMMGEGYTHAWVEAWCDGCWQGVDPTNSKIVDESYIKLSHGRDYNDTIVCKGHFYGEAKQKQEIKVQVVEIPESGEKAGI
ncbi:MAG: transglutaminase domain-containing protein [Lachnospiraceae bacterium]